MAEEIAFPHPAATVVLLRERGDSWEVLLVRRSRKLAFHGGAWVFPGGRIDSGDFAPQTPSDDVVPAARRAAVRETHEEAGLRVSPEDLVLFSRWVTPVDSPKRFDTWFFAARTVADEVRVDGDEIDGHRWLHPHEALAEQRRGAIDLPPPTFVTLTVLASFERVDQLLTEIGSRFVSFLPRLVVTEDGACTLYPGDAGYGAGDFSAPGARHRLWMADGRWRYQRD